MAISTIKEIYGRQYSDEFQNIRAVMVYRAHCDAPILRLADLMDDPMMPPLGAYYSVTHPELRCVNREIGEIDRSNTEFDVTFNFEMFPFHTWDVQIGSQSVEVVLDETKAPLVGVGIPTRFNSAPGKYLSTLPAGAQGETVLNRANDPFDPPVMGQRTQIVITCNTIVEEIADLGFANVGMLQRLVGKVNSERVQIFSIPDEGGIGCDYWSLLLDDVSVTKIKKPTGCNLAVSYRIIYDPLGHCPVVLNAGFNELVGAPIKRRKIRDKAQVEISAPVPLDKDGKALLEAALPAGATYIVCPSRETFDFTTLLLPTTFCGLMPTPAP